MRINYVIQDRMVATCQGCCQQQTVLRVMPGTTPEMLMCYDCLKHATNQLTAILEPSPSITLEDKPPIGVMPRDIWLELRAKDLAEGISRYLPVTGVVAERSHKTRTLAAWARELESILEERKGK